LKYGLGRLILRLELSVAFHNNWCLHLFRSEAVAVLELLPGARDAKLLVLQLLVLLVVVGKVKLLDLLRLRFLVLP